MAFLGLEGKVFPIFRPLRGDQRVALVGDALPDFLGDEGHEGMQQPQNLVKHVHQHLNRGLLADRILGVQPRLGQLDIPVAVGVPDEVVHLLDGHAQLVLFQILRDLGDQRVQLGQHPPVGNFQLVKGRQLVLGVLAQIHQHIAGSVPQLIGKVAHGLALLGVETGVVSGRVAGDQVHPQGVAAVLVDHFQRVNAVAQRLGHLASLIVPHQTVDKHGVEGRLAGMLAAGEDHSRNPEENDVVARDQHVRRVEIVKVFRLFRPAQRFKGPQSGGEPGIQHVGVTLNVGAAALFALADIFPGHGDVAAVGARPCGNLMTPPQLTGNAPVADILHPVEIGLAEPLGDELGLPFLDDPDGFLGQRLHLHEPLGGDDRLHVLMAAVAGADVVAVRLHLHQISARFQIGDDLLSGLVAIETLILSAVFVDPAVVVQHPDDLQIVAQTHLKVVGVVGGGHLNAAGAKVHLGVIVSDDGDFLIHKGKNDHLAHDVLVALVVGVDAHAGVAQHGLGTGGRHDHLAGAVGQRVADVPQVAGLVHILHLSVGQGGDAVGAPVDNAAALVDQTLFVQRDEDLPHGLGAALVHGEPGTLPVAACAQLLLLLHNAVAVFVLPIPDALQKLFTTKIVAGQALLAKLLLHLDLGGDAGVIDAGNPQGVVALHPLEPDQGILQCRVHGVTHVQLTGDVGWGHDDGEGLLAFIHLGVEVAALLPHVVDFGFHLLRLVDLW